MTRIRTQTGIKRFIATLLSAINDHPMMPLVAVLVALYFINS